MPAPHSQRAPPRGRPFLYCALAAAAAAAAFALLRPRAERWDVLLVTIDTLRADALGAEDTPALLDAVRAAARVSSARARRRR